MKTRKIYELNGTQEEAIKQAFEILMDAARRQPDCNHTVTVPLADGKFLKIFASAHSQQVYFA